MPQASLFSAPPPVSPEGAPRLVAHRTRHRIAPFRFLRAESFEAADILLRANPGAVPMAGGLDVVNRMKEGETPPAVVWLGAIPGADAITHEGDDLVIGATCRHDQLATSPLVRALLPDLAAAWGRIASSRIRAQGTVVGNVMADVPAYEGPALLAALGARLTVLANDRSETLALADRQEEGTAPVLVTALRVPLAAPGVVRRLVYDRSLRPALAVALRLDVAEGRVLAARAVLGAGHARPVVRAVPATGRSLGEMAAQAPDLAAQAFADLPDFTTPWAGRTAYRRRVAPQLLSRLLKEAAR